MKQILVRILLCAPLTQTVAAELSVTVRDNQAQPLVNAVVFLEQDSEVLPPPSAAAIDQIDKQFVPRVSVVQVGTKIQFPNHDKIRHHVYSFSPAKPFELPLYSGIPASPVLFARPGLVTLGCNIHDQMIGYLYVVPASRYRLTDAAGAAKFRDLPTGSYRLSAWHFRQLKLNEAPRTLVLGTRPESVTIDLALQTEDPTPPPLDPPE